MRLTSATTYLAIVIYLATLSPSHAHHYLEDLSEAKAIAITKGDTPLQKLLKERHNAAIQELESSKALYYGGRAMLADVIDASQRVLHSKLELSSDVATKIKIHEKHVERAKVTEKLAEAKVKGGVETLATFARATQHRCDAEIGLLRAKSVKKP